ncbi:MAG: efflux RND transporter periplasmic adaptor subunit [Spirochaetales bacterium]|nr:efflux RND transporter periplasmic adaptor subunit [Spirochaetales bacterium]MDY5914266.1 efflux RND transporter periplasmic adaptor subunit [Treponema sp.]
MQKTTKIIVTHVIVGVILILTFIAVKMIGSSKKSASGMPGMMPPANSMAGGGAGGGTAKPGSSTSKEAAAGNGTSGAGAGNASGGTGMSTNGAGKNGMASAGNTMPGNANSNTSGKKSQTVTPVRTVVANEVILQDYVMTSGDIQTQTSIEVFPSIGGTIVQMNVSLGSPVKKGDVIGYIDPSEPGSYYAKSPITCPISGSILTAPAKPGQKVQASSVITKIGDIENLQISAKIPERYVSELSVGQKAEIKLEAYPDVSFSASVVRISPVVDSATRTKEIILNFDKKDSRINAGMFAKVKLFTSAYKGTFAIGQDSIVSNSDKNYLFVVNDDDTVSKREVTLGKNVDGYYQILSGIEFGETVVTEGMLTLYEGAKVRDIGK